MIVAGINKFPFATDPLLEIFRQNTLSSDIPTVGV